MKTNTRKITIIAMFCAMAFLLTLPPFKIPFNGFLDLEVKDTIITIGAFLLGPIAGLVVSIIVPFIEMLTVSHTGPIGMLMNALASCSFVCTAAFIYKRKHNMKGAVIGLAVGGRRDDCRNAALELYYNPRLHECSKACCCKHVSAGSSAV